MRSRHLVSILMLIIFPYAIFSCRLNEKDYSEEKTIEELVKEDIQDEVFSTSNLELNLPDLPTKKYVSDKDHSSISFRTGHWEIVDIIGWFNDFQVIMYSDSSDFTDAIIYGKVDPTSIQMPNEKMTGSAQREPYIDSETYPEVTFLSTKISKMEDSRYELPGTFEMNGIKKEITFDVLFNGFAYPGEKTICGFNIYGKINRNDFKIGGQDMLHSGRKVHSDTIYLEMAMRME